MFATEENKFNHVAKIICNKPIETSFEECHKLAQYKNRSCINNGKCRIKEKTSEQIDYILSDKSSNVFLKACPGSGKTEVVGLKAAYEINKWENKYSGIAILTFTNNATDVIRNRVNQFAGIVKASYPHYIGTIDSWLHGYLFNPFAHLITKYDCSTNGNRGIQIIENQNNAEFLKSELFLTQYSYFKRGNVQANQYYFQDNDLKKVVFNSGDIKNDIQRNNNGSELSDWQIEDLRNTKKEFWKSGFVTHQDVEIICLKILQENKYICNLLSKRFQNMIIDECQDISPIKLQIFDLLKRNKTSFHFIGDLNQSIFSYSHDVIDINQYCEENGFKIYKLSNNLRSVQSIVNLCNTLIPPKNEISGLNDLPEREHCVLFYYGDNSWDDVTNKFKSSIQLHNCDITKSSIIVRNHNLKSKILSRKYDNKMNSKFYPPIAIKNWDSARYDDKIDSLSKMGHFMCDKLYPGLQCDSDNFFCPKTVYAHKWRLFVSQILHDCCNDEHISNLDLKWNKWRKIFDEKFPAILENSTTVYNWLPLENIKDAKLKQVPKKIPPISKIPVIETISGNSKSFKSTIPIITIHSAKGVTYDAILLVSNSSNSGQNDNSGSGYWKQWLDSAHDSGESSRLAYVASSRPRLLLAWAIPKKDYTSENVNRLKKIGFSPHDKPLADPTTGQITLF